MMAALSLFVALIAGSALRPKFAAAALPEPAAWSQGTLDVGASARRVQLRADFQAMSHLDQAFSRGFAPMNKTNKKPFHSMWMTRERPSTWTRLSPRLLWSWLSASFAPWGPALGFQPGGAHTGAPAGALADQDILTQLCVVRR